MVLARRPPARRRPVPGWRDVRDAAVAINPDVIVPCHEGPIAEPADAQHVLDMTTGVGEGRHRLSG